jgi:hypothetical protein
MHWIVEIGVGGLLIRGPCASQGVKKCFRPLRSGKGDGFVDDIERHPGDAEHRCPLFFFAHGGRACFAGEEAFQLRGVHARGRNNFNQFRLIGEVRPLAKVAAEESFDDGVLHAGSSRQPDESMRIKCVGRVLLQIVTELNADRFSGGCDLRVHRQRLLPTAKLFAAIRLSVQALARDVGIELKRMPRARDISVGRKSAECFFHTALADIAPRANKVRVYGN